MPTPVERFWSKVDKHGPTLNAELGPCHIWTAGTDIAGYGRFGFLGKNQKASRVAWYIEHGKWPDPCALHRCDNRLCVRHDHLFEGTRAQNIADMNAKQRGRPCIGEANGRSKVTAAQVQAIREAADGGESFASIARRLMLTKVQVSAIVNRRQWKHV